MADEYQCSVCGAEVIQDRADLGLIKYRTVLCNAHYDVEGARRGKLELKMGDTGAAVRGLQVMLTTVSGLAMRQDGNFSLLTHQRLIFFQQERRLAADGIVGRRTWMALDEAYELELACRAKTWSEALKGAADLDVKQEERRRAFEAEKQRIRETKRLFS